MRIKLLFTVWLLFLLALLVLVGYFYGDLHRVSFYVVEGTVLLMLCFLSYFYGKVLKPMRTIGNGMDLLREQDFSSRLSPVGQHEADRLVNLFNRMMDQLKSERLRLREQNHFLDLLIKASPMGVVILTFDEEVSHLNPMALRQLGIKEAQAIGRKLADVDAPLAHELAKMERETTAVIRLNDANVYKCSYSYFIDYGFPHPFLLIERMTDEVMRAEKRAYEKVVRMIAHEVNNSVAGVTSALDTVQQALQEEEAMRDVCDMMEVCAQRCLSMSRFITRFADVVKIPVPMKQPVHLNALAEKCTHFMEGVCGDNGISLVFEADCEVGEVLLDAAQVEQVLVNIIKNAVESLCGASVRPEEPRIVVRTETPAVVEVVDNGPGISPEVEGKLFTPFFSTKPNGQGIGLVFIREVLSRHGCTFSLRTGEDGLTRFRIAFR